MHSLEAYYDAFCIERDLALARAHRLSQLGAPLARDHDLQRAPQPRRRHGWLPGFSRTVS